MVQSLRTELGKVRGYGSAHHGVQHWWMQRLSALALLPLTLWMIYGVLTLSGAGEISTYYQGARDFIASPVHAIFASLWVICSFYHLKLGLQVVIEDYVHSEFVKLSSLTALNFVTIGTAIACLLAIVVIVTRT